MKPILPALLLCIAGLCATAQNIVLNSSFGNRGFITKAPDKKGNVFGEGGKQVLELPDGKLLSIFAANTTTIITRYNTNNSIDKSYGKDGYSINPHITQTNALLTQEGKLILIGVRNISGKTYFEVDRYDETGKLDSSFGNLGVNIIPMTNQNDQLQMIVPQKDGKILLLANPINGSQEYILRIQKDGTLDTSFAKGGYLQYNLTGAIDVSGIAVEGTSIFAGITSLNSAGNDFIILKNLVNGLPDAAFGENGMVKIDMSQGDQCAGLAVQSDGKIVFGGSVGAFTWSADKSIIIRLLKDGKLDSTFNQTGVASIFIGSHYGSYIKNIGIDSLNRITVTSLARKVNNDFLFTRFTSNGILDKSFGDGGTTILETDGLGENYDNGYLQKDGSFLGTGYVYANSEFDNFIIRLKPNGQPDLNLGPNGELISYYPGKSSTFGKPIILSDGKVLTSYQGKGDTTIQGLICLLPDGTIDTGFGENGILDSVGFTFQILQNQKIVTFVAPPYNSDNTYGYVMRRYTQDGKPDLSFGVNGQKKIEFLNKFMFSSSAIQPDDKIVLLGNDQQISVQKSYLVRINPDGSHDQQFGIDGELLCSTVTNDHTEQVLIQASNKIVVKGFYTTSDNSNHYFIRRFNYDGSIDESFGTKGAILDNHGTNSFLNYVISQSDNKLLGVFIYSFDNAFYYSTLIRLKTDGTIDSSFGQNGGVKDIVPAAVLENNKIMIATAVQTGDRYDAALSRLNSDGSFDESFATNGYLKVKLSDQNNAFNEITVKDDKLFATGSINSTPDQEAAIASFIITDQPIATLNCNKDTTVKTDPGKCSAIVKSIDPKTSLPDSTVLVKYVLSGATSGSGTGTASGLTFNKGITAVTYTLKKDSTQTCSFKVKVEDKEAPVIKNLISSITSFLIPNHQMRNVSLNYTALDNCGPVQVKIVIASNEPAISSGSDTTAIDWEVISANLIHLRAEHSGQDSSRIYTITVIATDEAGNQSSASTTVAVPKGTASKALAAMKKAFGDLEIITWPNPAIENFMIRINSSNLRDKIHLRLLDMNGRMVGYLDASPKQTVKMGAGLKSGMYVLDATQGTKRANCKLVKLSR